MAALAENGVLEVEGSERKASRRPFASSPTCSCAGRSPDYRAGRRVGYYVDPGALGKRDRATLLDALRVIHGLRKRAHLEFAAQVF